MARGRAVGFVEMPGANHYDIVFGWPSAKAAGNPVLENRGLTMIPR
jgi:hypothetical protein